MRIGEFANKAGVNIQTVRYYERRRLLRAPARTSGGYRSYQPSDLEHLRFIKWCQRLGFTLTEIRELLPLHAAVAQRRSPKGRTELKGIAAMLEEKLRGIEGRIKELRQLKGQLLRSLNAIGTKDCPTCPASVTGSTSPAPSGEKARKCPQGA